MKPIQEGDQVTIVTTTNLYPFQPVPKFDEQPGPLRLQYTITGAVVLSTPCDVGDCWAFEWEGHRFTLNPNCAAFVGLVWERKALLGIKPEVAGNHLWIKPTEGTDKLAVDTPLPGWDILSAQVWVDLHRRTDDVPWAVYVITDDGARKLYP